MFDLEKYFAASGFPVPAQSRPYARVVEAMGGRVPLLCSDKKRRLQCMAPCRVSAAAYQLDSRSGVAVILWIDRSAPSYSSS